MIYRLKRKEFLPDNNGINVHKSSIHFRRDSVSILPHCRSNHRTATSSVASVHELKYKEAYAV